MDIYYVNAWRISMVDEESHLSISLLIQLLSYLIRYVI